MGRIDTSSDAYLAYLACRVDDEIRQFKSDLELDHLGRLRGLTKLALEVLGPNATCRWLDTATLIGDPRSGFRSELLVLESAQSLPPEMCPHLDADRAVDRAVG